MSGGPDQDPSVKPTEGRRLPSVYLSYPHSRPHFDMFLRSVAFAVAHHGGYGDMWVDHEYGFSLDIARNSLHSKFLKSGQDFWLCVDNDSQFSPQAIERLVNHNLPMVCGCMYTRTVPPKPTIGRYVGRSKGGKDIYGFSGVAKEILAKAREHDITYKTATNDMLFPQTATDLSPVDGCGMHFTLIRRDVAEAIKPPAFVFATGYSAGEDFYFCRKVREKGFPIYVDLSVQTGHLDSEDSSFGIKELLYITQFMDLDALVETGNWEVGI